MKLKSTLAKTFIRGLAVLIPLVLTLYLVGWSLYSLESVVRTGLTLLIPEQYYPPGMGIAATFILIFLTGILMESSISQKIFGWFESLLEAIPVVGAVYAALKDFFAYFSMDEKDKASQVVLLTLPGTEQEVLGLLTNNSPHTKIDGISEESLAVYLPMSYQLGGYTLLVPPESVRRVEMPVEDALKFILTAGVAKKETVVGR